MIAKLKKSVPLSDSFLLPIAFVIGKFTDHIVPGLSWYFSLLIVVCAVLLIDGLLRLVRLDRIKVSYWVSLCILILGCIAGEFIT
ncbi:hypothetical protein JIR001_10910 [Polycladomyces abyssicola]|uniref:Uncharacterized protein n=1 Tax=Polycladomyces abyssicola TaxID=1125966 RepID=A0A8D5UFJ0_9BACL|nr:hypothetical protein [Polycladomyces abyssicola]BCU81308.1 hypothetical protein JIR001_10910 [Polycladomyces abyssicola]